MPIVSLPSVMTKAPLSGVWKATATRYIRKDIRISEWSFHSNRFDFVVLRNLVDHIQSLGDLSENSVDSVKVRLGRMTLSMAHAGKDTGGSQFFICHSPQPHLDGVHTVFGQVTKGLDVVNKIAQNDEVKSIRVK